MTAVVISDEVPECEPSERARLGDLLTQPLEALVTAGQQAGERIRTVMSLGHGSPVKRPEGGKLATPHFGGVAPDVVKQPVRDRRVATHEDGVYLPLAGRAKLDVVVDSSERDIGYVACHAWFG
jgi:hypothetical protein